MTVPRSGRRSPLTSSSTVWWPAPATPASPTTSPRATLQVERLEAPVDGHAAQLQPAALGLDRVTDARTCGATAGRIAEHRGDDRGHGQLRARPGAHRHRARRAAP